VTIKTYKSERKWKGNVGSRQFSTQVMGSKTPSQLAQAIALDF